MSRALHQCIGRGYSGEILGELQLVEALVEALAESWATTLELHLPLPDTSCTDRQGIERGAAREGLLLALGNIPDRPAGLCLNGGWGPRRTKKGL